MDDHPETSRNRSVSFNSPDLHYQLLVLGTIFNVISLNRRGRGPRPRPRRERAMRMRRWRSAGMISKRFAQNLSVTVLLRMPLPQPCSIPIKAWSVIYWLLILFSCGNYGPGVISVCCNAFFNNIRCFLLRVSSFYGGHMFFICSWILFCCRCYQRQWDTNSSGGEALGWAIREGSKTSNGWTLDHAVWGNHGSFWNFFICKT